MRALLLLSIALVLGCEPDETTPPVGPDGGVGVGGASVSLGISLENPTGLDVASVSLGVESVQMLSDREPAEAPTLTPVDPIAVHLGFAAAVDVAPPGAYSVLRIEASADSPALVIEVMLATIRVRVEIGDLPEIRLRCPAPIDLADGASMDFAVSLDVSGIESVLTSALLPAPIGVTEFIINETTDPSLVAQLAAEIVASLSLGCTAL